ncbi:hypothetical protein LAJ19_21465 (plasmid) [Deinococcus taeanensis]|uniref:hypothetical protein n=1 Tax=Deinococcus taeanensis TaxID=2737050 RepID=UPI001CDB98DD|nr:hypothetical protein [Deinococcus taeanensis]UBV45554.1 hypothetical protein LAJ19_21465 [Deinococcus taeanensis]
MTRWDRDQSIRVGWALDRALAEGRAPADLHVAAQALLPGRYLTALGWLNLTHLPAVIVSLLISRSESEHGANPRFADLAKWLWSQQDARLAATCGYIAAAMMGEKNARGQERNAPRTISGTLSSLAPLLRRPEESPLTPGNINTYLRNYALGVSEGTSHLMASTRVQNLRLYIVATDAQTRLIENEPHLEGQLAPWALPLFSAPLDLDDLLLQARADQTARRQRRLDALMPKILPLFLVNECRSFAFQALYAAAKEARLRFVEGGRAPLQYDVTLPDHSATLSFRITTDRHLDQEARDMGSALPNRFSHADVVLTEYLGAYSPSGEPLEKPFFAVLHDAWYDTALRQCLLGAGHRKLDFTQGRSGVMRPSGGLHRLCQQHYACARAAGQQPRVLLDMDALSAGVAYGTLFVLLTLATGMRIHEGQQIRIDKGYSGRSEGYFTFQVLAKYGKRAPQTPTFHQVPKRLNPHITHLMALHEERWPGWPVLHPERAKAMGYTTGKYLFSTGTACLLQTHLRGLARHCSLGVELEGLADFFAAHDLRYANTLARLDLGTPLHVIQEGLGHRYKDTTLTYTFGQTTSTTHLQPIPQQLTLWESLQARLPTGL